MITRTELDRRARALGIEDVIVENDYVLGWLLWGIGSDPALRQRWVFKGGTCLNSLWTKSRGV